MPWTRTCALGLLTSSGLALCSCAYELRPEPPQAMPVSREAALPLRVGVVEDTSDPRVRYYAQGRTRKLSDALRASGLFQWVERTTEATPGRYDLVVRAKMEIDYHFSLFPFLPLCDPLLLGCFLRNHDRAETSAEVSVEDAAGRRLKTYSESFTAALSYQIGAAKARRDMVRSSVEHLAAKLAEDFIQDRALYQQVRPDPGRAASPAPQPRAATAGEKSRVEHESENLRP